MHITMSQDLIRNASFNEKSFQHDLISCLVIIEKKLLGASCCSTLFCFIFQYFSSGMHCFPGTMPLVAKKQLKASCSTLQALLVYSLTSQFSIILKGCEACHGGCMCHFDIYLNLLGSRQHAQPINCRNSRIKV